MDTNAHGLNEMTATSVHLNLTFTDLQVINEALLDMPVRTAMPVINTINQQLTEQYQAQQAAAQQLAEEAAAAEAEEAASQNVSGDLS